MVLGTEHHLYCKLATLRQFIVSETIHLSFRYYHLQGGRQQSTSSISPILKAGIWLITNVIDVNSNVGSKS